MLSAINVFSPTIIKDPCMLKNDRGRGEKTKISHSSFNRKNNLLYFICIGG